MNFALNSTFRPFTYDEMIKPLVQYKEAYDKLEQDYSDLAKQTETWKNIVNRTKSPEAYEMYQRYSNDLRAITDSLSKGMNINNRRALLGMKRRYAQDIEPIAKAHERQQALAEEQRKAELSNPTMMWQRRADDMSLDDFINDPTANYGKSYSGASLIAQVAAGAGALAKEFRDNPNKMKQLVGGDYYEYIKQRGFSSEAVLAAIMNSSNASPVLTQLLESSIDATGIREWENQDALEQAYNYAKQGLWSAVGQDESQIVQNWRAQENLKHAHDMEKYQLQASLKRPREMLGKDGKPTGEFFDPSINMIVDKHGNILSNAKSADLIKLLSGKKGDSNPSKKEVKELMPPLYFDAFYVDTSSGLDYKKSWDGNLEEAKKQKIYSKGKHLHPSGINNTLSTRALGDIRDKLPKGYTLKDIDVYVDFDYWGDSHYIVVDANGDITGLPYDTDKITTTTSKDGEKLAFPQ